MPTDAPNGLINSFVVRIGGKAKRSKKAAGPAPEPVEAVEPDKTAEPSAKVASPKDAKS